MLSTPDFTIIGAGILGLSVARELSKKFPCSKIEILEKESAIGLHASGRNSGVLHSGIYYKEGSVKARVCSEGARQMAEYCHEHSLPIKQYGKVIIPIRSDDDPVIDTLFERGRNNGAHVEIINGQQLLELEPNVNVVTGRALYSPNTSVIDSKSIMNHMVSSFNVKNVNILYEQRVVAVDPRNKTIITTKGKYGFRYVINTSGLYADKIAHLFGLGKRYMMLPFKGLYYDVARSDDCVINRLIYPIPDMNVPFLGVHFTKNIAGKIFVGPTAILAMGRENYEGIKGLNLPEFGGNLVRVSGQYIWNRDGFRRYVHEEASRFIKQRFVDAVRQLIPKIRASDLTLSKKVGIRAQLYDKENKQLVSDFLIINDSSSLHVLNAVSPAFTSAFEFARYVVRRI